MLVKLLLPALLSFASLSCTTAVKVPSTEAPAAAEAGVAWSKVLKTHVDEMGRVDFAALNKNPANLHKYVAYITKTKPSSFEDANDRLAYYLNSYNALAMYGVLEAGIPNDFDGFFKRLGFFVNRSYVIGGVRKSLYDYENSEIRPLGDPRVHVALNCMSVGCPRLPQKAFIGSTLDEDLNAYATEFFNSKKYVQVDEQQKIAKISEILDFFTDDFVNPNQADSIIAYVNRYRKMKIPADYSVEFITYDWTVNRQ